MYSICTHIEDYTCICIVYWKSVCDLNNCPFSLASWNFAWLSKWAFWKIRNQFAWFSHCVFGSVHIVHLQQGRFTNTLKSLGWLILYVGSYWTYLSSGHLCLLLWPHNFGDLNINCWSLSWSPYDYLKWKPTLENATFYSNMYPLNIYE